MTDFKLVIGDKNGKSHQRDLKSPDADNLLKLRIGSSVSGDLLGYPGFEFLITGGSDKCGFPMRKGIQQPRKRVLIGKSVGYSGLDRSGKKQDGLVKRRTVCGEMITKIIHQVNLKVVKDGAELFVSEVKEKK